MDFLKKLFRGGTAKHDKRYHTFPVKCKRCGEVIEGRVDLDNDVSLGDSGVAYFARKVLMGDSGRCFQQIEVVMKFTSTRELIEREIQGGTFVE